MKNQCDGCQAGIPVVNGNHRMGREGGYPDLMGCTAKLYNPGQSDQTRQEIIDLAWKECGVQGDFVRQLATVLVNRGYRKFEIVEDEV